MKLRWLFISVFLLIAPIVFAGDELSMVTAISQSLTKEEKQKTWPEFNINSSPILIFFNNKHNYAFNFIPANPEWKILEDQSRPVYRLDYDAYDIQSVPWRDGYLIDSQPSFIFNIEFMDIPAEDAEHVLFHERFHMFQLQNFPSHIYNYGKYNGFNSNENIKLTLLEDMALENYLASGDQEAMQDYVAINQYRETLIDKESADYEEKKENLEGLADYYGWNLVFSNSVKRNEAIIESYKSKCDLDHLIKCQIHDRYYFTGNALAVALDVLSPVSWKEKLVKHKLSIRKQLFQYFGMTQTEILERVKTSKIKYDFDLVTSPIENAIEAYKDNRNRELSAYEKMEGILFHIEKSPCNLFGLISTQKIYYLDSDTRFILGSSGNSSCSDESIQINYLHTPYILEIQQAGETQIKIAPDSVMYINNKLVNVGELALKNSTYPFTSFSLRDSSIEIFISNIPGHIKVYNHKLYLIFENYNEEKPIEKFHSPNLFPLSHNLTKEL